MFTENVFLIKITPTNKTLPLFYLHRSTQCYLEPTLKPFVGLLGLDFLLKQLHLSHKQGNQVVLKVIKYQKIGLQKCYE